MKNKILTITICVVVLFSLFVLPAAAWGISVPEYSAYKKGDVTVQEFLNASSKRVVVSKYSSTQGSVNATFNDPDFQAVSRMQSGAAFGQNYGNGMVQFSLPVDDGETYQSYMIEYFQGVADLQNIDVNSYDVYLEYQAFALEVPVEYAASHSPNAFWIIPYYAKPDGSDIKSGNYISMTSFTTRQVGDYMIWQIGLTPQQCFAIAASDVPEGYILYGFGYRWNVTGAFSEITNFYVSNLYYSLYTPSDASTTAINNMSDKLSADIQSMGDKISNSIEEKADEILKGWTPNPVAPDGSDDITEYEQKEQQLLEGQQEGINLGLNTIDGVGDRLFNYRAGFTVVIGLFDLLMGVDWIHTVLTVGLALGIVGFILSIPVLLGRASRKR